MPGTISPNLPVLGEQNTVADPETRESLETLRDALNGILNSENKVDPSLFAEADQIKFTWYPPKVISSEQSRESSAFSTLETADEIKSIVVPENGLLLLGYSALVSSTVEKAGRAAFYIGNNQLKVMGTTTPAVQEAETTGVANEFKTCTSILSGLKISPFGTSFVTTGMALSQFNAAVTETGGLCYVHRLAPGTYNVSVQYRATSGKVKAKERILYAAVYG